MIFGASYSMPMRQAAAAVVGAQLALVLISCLLLRRRIRKQSRRSAAAAPSSHEWIHHETPPSPAPVEAALEVVTVPLVPDPVAPTAAQLPADPPLPAARPYAASHPSRDERRLIAAAIMLGAVALVGIAVARR
jgi:hypothetical protein